MFLCSLRENTETVKMDLKCALYYFVIVSLFGHDNCVFYLYCYFFYHISFLIFYSLSLHSSCCNCVSVSACFWCSLVSVTSPDLLLCSLEGSEPTQTLYRLLSQRVQLQRQLQNIHLEPDRTRQNQLVVTAAATEPGPLCRFSSTLTSSPLTSNMKTTTIENEKHIFMPSTIQSLWWEIPNKGDNN